MQSTAKWLVAGGAFLLVIAFLLPLFTVSHQDVAKGISLLQIAGVPYLFFLYLVPLGALTTLLLALVPADDPKLKKTFLIGQIGGIGLGFLLILGTFVYFLFKPQLIQEPSSLGGLLPPEFLSTEFDIWPGIGLFVLLLGFGIAVFGLLTELFPSLEGFVNRQTGQAVTHKAVSSPEPKVDFVPSGPRLEFKKGKLANQIIIVKGDDFSIGRGRDNDLQLPDPERKISRVHARLRFAQNAWFIQDQNSKVGTFVNGKQVKATRLSSGDEIRIGEHTFKFNS